ncbi:unnamed protein product [Brassica rapa]|uniref:Chalcone/stilbene synthase N-terminal domain-containing protein n=2 Tax=Brassica TaxID=3705 RepID=A0A3P5YGH4_BRACM|nr:unnamed protein product [Brassica napus]CAG7864739.1 unnamed protein product [Brassica rapa]CDY16200.1 BnaA09g29340D [Brassica napus]VDC61915.1 unnamed protein product [Brassica rapa]
MKRDRKVVLITSSCHLSLDFKEVQRLNLWHEVFDTSLSEIPASSSLSLDVVVTEVPKLGKEAGVKIIKEWGQPKSKIKQVVICTTSGVDMPGADHQLTKLLGLRPSVKRLMMYQQGCFAGGTVLRLAKDLAENNRGARVSWSSPRSQPSPSAALLTLSLTHSWDRHSSVTAQPHSLSVQTLTSPLEPIFEMVSAVQTMRKSYSQTLTVP